MTPQLNDNEMRLVELIQYATIKRQEYIDKFPHALDNLRVKYEDDKLTIGPYNTLTSDYLANIIKQAGTLQCTARLQSRMIQGDYTLEIVISPNPTKKKIDNVRTIQSDYYRAVERIY